MLNKDRQKLDCLQFFLGQLWQDISVHSWASGDPYLGIFGVETNADIINAADLTTGGGWKFNKYASFFPVSNSHRIFFLGYYFQGD